MKFEEIQYQWTLDCVMDETELSQESIKIPQLHNKYLIYYSNEKLKFKEIKYLFAGLIKRKRDYYSGRMTAEELEAADWEPFQYKLLKADVQEYIDADDNVIESKKFLTTNGPSKIFKFCSSIKLLNFISLIIFQFFKGNHCPHLFNYFGVTLFNPFIYKSGYSFTGWISIIMS